MGKLIAFERFLNARDLPVIKDWRIAVPDSNKWAEPEWYDSSTKRMMLAIYYCLRFGVIDVQYKIREEGHLKGRIYGGSVYSEGCIVETRAIRTIECIGKSDVHDAENRIDQLRSELNNLIVTTWGNGKYLIRVSEMSDRMLDNVIYCEYALNDKGEKWFMKKGKVLSIKIEGARYYPDKLIP